MTISSDYNFVENNYGMNKLKATYGELEAAIDIEVAASNLLSTESLDLNDFLKSSDGFYLNIKEG